MIQSRDISITAPDGPLPAYIARPATPGPHPAVIVLEGVYGFDDELKRITDLVASLGYIGLAINYFHRTNPDFKESFTPEGRARGEAAARAVTKASIRSDIEAARDWLNHQDFVKTGRLGMWGFGFGGTAAFVASTLAGFQAAVVFYGQSIASLMPSGEAAPLEDVSTIRTPLLLVFGGKDDLIGAHQVELITQRLRRAEKNVDVQLYPNVGHSFFRSDPSTISAREAADAWDRVVSFFGKRLQ